MIDIKPILACVMQTSLHKPVEPADWLNLIANQAGKLRFGVARMAMHDSRVAHIRRTGEVRLAHHAAEPLDSRQTRLTR